MLALVRDITDVFSVHAPIVALVASLAFIRSSSGAERLAHYVLFKALWAFACNALDGHGFQPADRSDVAQDALFTAWRKRATYDPDRGTLEQWLSGILRYTALTFRRQRGRGPVLVPGNVPMDIPTEALNPEDSVSLSLLAEYAFSFLPLEERRVVTLHEFEGKPLREIATMEKIVYSTAQARLKRGLARLQKANDEGTIGASFSAALGITGGAWSEPPPEIAGRWRASTPPRSRRCRSTLDTSPAGRRPSGSGSGPRSARATAKQARTATDPRNAAPAGEARGVVVRDG